MPRFNVASLGSGTKSIYEHQRTWGRNNWHESLTQHATEVEQLLDKLSTLEIWNSKLQSNPVAKELIPEIWMDNYVSITLACIGLYKHANMSLRTGLETGLRLIYFSTHPVEYGWWKSGSRFGQDHEKHDVWGGGYDYFGMLFSEFEKECSADNMDLFKAKQKCLVNLYNCLSGSIHTQAKRFQTTTGYSPKYNKAKFCEWKDFFLKTNTYLNTLLALGFSTQFKKLQSNDKTKILDVGIGSYYKDKVKKVLAE
jgi:methionine salvage enolase-phosphatase E1